MKIVKNKTAMIATALVGLLTVASAHAQTFDAEGSRHAPAYPLSVGIHALAQELNQASSVRRCKLGSTRPGSLVAASWMTELSSLERARQCALLAVSGRTRNQDAATDSLAIIRRMSTRRFPPVVGLYASILPIVIYAVFGTSRQLIVNPDAATCAMVAAIVVPLAGLDVVCLDLDPDLPDRQLLRRPDEAGQAAGVRANSGCNPHLLPLRDSIRCL